jgi:RNA polymerase sigma-70 factor (ECF subfamily)
VEALYLAHHRWLHDWLYRKLGNVWDAADLAQDTFLRVLARHPTPEIKEPRAYLSTIARGLVVDHWRRRELERAWLETLGSMPVAEEPSPESHQLFLETLIQIDTLLDSMKPRMRKAFLHAQLDGLTCIQIAKRLGVSRATVERDISQALRICYKARFES